MHDVGLAVLHHLAVFTLVALLAVELAHTRRGMGADTVVRLANTDRYYGLLSLIVIAVGFSRAVFAAKGWDYYAANTFFWAKMGAFAGVGLLSIRPTLAFLKWRRAGTAPGDAEVAGVRRFLVAEAALVALILVFAVLMARGYGSF